MRYSCTGADTPTRAMQTLLRRTLQAGARLAPRAGVFAGAAALSVAAAGTASLDAPAPALSPAEFRPFKLTKVEKITHDTSLYRCAALLSLGLACNADTASQLRTAR